MQSHAESAVNDRRLLLRHALQEYKERGGQITLPVGSAGFDDWLMDALEVPLVLEAIGKRGAMDLILMCSAGSTLNNSILSHLPPEQGAPGASDAGSDGAGARRRAAPHLQLPSMAVDVDERDLQLLAFQIFAFAAGDRASPDLAAAVRAQLEIGEALGRDLTAVVAQARKAGVPCLTRIDALVQLLQAVPPSAFQSFKSFAAWRSSVAAVLSKSLEHAAAHSWAPRGGGGDGAGGAAPARALLAALRGSLRRMDVREADDYDEGEYAAAVRGVADAAGRLAANLRSGAALPLGLAVQVAEELLGAVFDSLDEGQFIPEAQELLGLLNTAVWPQLGISPAMTSALAMWVHFRQWTSCRETSLLQAGAAMARAAAGGAGGGAAGEAGFTQAVLGALSSEAAAALSDYHASFERPGEMAALVEFLGAVEAARGAGGGLQPLLDRCIRASVGAAFARRAGEVHGQASLEEDRTALLATETAALLHLERSQYVPVLRGAHPGAAGVAAAALHELYGAKLLSWLIQVKQLTKSVAATIHASVDLEHELLAEVGAAGGGGARPAPWGAAARVAPLLQTWAQTQVGNMHGWLDRLMADEDWSPVVEARGATARSAVEAVKAAEDAVETLFDLGVEVPAGVARALMEGLDGLLSRYCRLALADLGTADSLMPLAPPQTRYKKDVAEAAEAEALGGAKGLKSVASKVGAALSAPWLPALTKDEQQRVLGVMYDTLVVRANSMHYLAVRAADLEGLVADKWAAAAAEHGAAGALPAGALEGAVAAAAEATDAVLRFITLKLICGDLRAAIFKELYAFRVEAFRLGPVLEETDAALGMLCEMLAEALAPRMAGHVCKTLAAAVLHVLLDGGPHRLFTLADVPMLQQDFEHLKAMFYAEGAGLDPGAVARLCAPLHDALAAMATETPALIAAAKATKKQPLKAGGGADTIALPVLCHRADYEASKFLKKEYKIPKKLPNVFSASVSRSFSAAFPSSASKPARRMEATA